MTRWYCNTDWLLHDMQNGIVKLPGFYMTSSTGLKWNKVETKRLVCCQQQPPEVFFKKCVLKKFAKFTGKQLCQIHFFNKAAGLKPATLLRKRLWHKCFPVNFEMLLRTPSFIEYLWTTTSVVVKYLLLMLSQSNGRRKSSSVSVHEKKINNQLLISICFTATHMFENLKHHLVSR